MIFRRNENGSQKPYVKPEIKFFPAGSLQYTAVMEALNEQPQKEPKQTQEEKHVQSPHH